VIWLVRGLDCLKHYAELTSWDDAPTLEYLHHGDCLARRTSLWLSLWSGRASSARI